MLAVRLTSRRFLTHHGRSLRHESTHDLHRCGRPFSASTTRPASYGLDAVLTLPNALLDGIHFVGLPWFAAVPVAALVVRGLVGYHFMKQNHERRRIMTHLNPLTILQFRSEEKDRRKGSSRPDVPSPLRGWHILTARYKVQRTFGMRFFPYSGLANFGILILMSEAIRAKSGTREGLLSMLWSPLSSLWSGAGTVTQAVSGSSPEQTQPPTAPVDPAEAFAQTIEQRKMALDAAQTSDPSSIPLSSTDGSVGKAVSSFFDESMQVEGLWWCTDLTVPDPTLLLPFILSAVMATTALIGRKPAQNSSSLNKTRASDVPNLPEHLTALGPPKSHPLENLTFKERIDLSFALLFGIAATNIPAAIILYLIPSFVLTFLQRRWLDIRHPIHQSPLPCRRPVRKETEQLFDDA